MERGVIYFAGYVTPNAATSEMSFTASAVEYVYGTAVVFTVSATDRFVSRDAPSVVQRQAAIYNSVSF